MAPLRKTQSSTTQILAHFLVIYVHSTNCYIQRWKQYKMLRIPNGVPYRYSCMLLPVSDRPSSRILLLVYSDLSELPLSDLPLPSLLIFSSVNAGRQRAHTGWSCLTLRLAYALSHLFSIFLWNGPFSTSMTVPSLPNEIFPTSMSILSSPVSLLG